MAAAGAKSTAIPTPGHAKSAGGRRRRWRSRATDELVLERLLLGLLRDARAESRAAIVVEAPDEGRELVVPLEDDAVREVALLDLARIPTESRRVARAIR